MFFSCLQENIKKGLNITSNIANKNPNFPILNNIQIIAKNNNIQLLSTNLEIGIITNIRGKIEKDGVLLINAKILNEFINLLPNEKINFELSQKNLKINCQNYKTKINISNLEEYPLIPGVKKETSITINAELFKKSLSQIIFAVPHDNAKLELNGLLFIIKENELTIAGTDTYRLTEKKIEIQNKNKQDVEIIIPVKTIYEIIRLLSNYNDEDQVKIYISENQILFEYCQTQLISRLIEGNYPDYQQIIPKENKTKIIANKNELLKAVKVSAIFSKNENNDINLDFPKDENKIIISSTSNQEGESVIELEADVIGDDNGINVNYKYLLEGLNNIESDKIEIKIINNSTPCIIKGMGDENYLYLVMPIKK